MDVSSCVAFEFALFEFEEFSAFTLFEVVAWPALIGALFVTVRLG